MHNILSVAYPLTMVGEDAVGGSEQVLTSLDRTITEAGHHSIVIAATGSQIMGTHIESRGAPSLLDDVARADGARAHRTLLAKTLARYPVDLIHFHSLDFHHYVPEDVPVLATLHLPSAWYPEDIFAKHRDSFWLNCVSKTQWQSCPQSPHLLPPIPNGVRIPSGWNQGAREGFALAMGRICPEKGFHLALDAAAAAGMPLLLAGEVFPYEEHITYFEREIKPRLDSNRWFIGTASLAEKQKLLAQARCLLITSTVPETSSLVAMEALASGTPVVAFPVGAIPEIIANGQTGFLVNDTAEMSQALQAVDSLDRAACRAHAETEFSADRMGRRYLELYDRLIDTARLLRLA